MTEQRDERPTKGYPDSLGPDIRSGGEQVPGGPVPPYEGRKTATPRAEAEAMASVYSVDYSDPAPRREISETERKGVPPTDTTAASPMGVGDKTAGKPGNEKSLTWSEEKQRKDREVHGIDRRKPVDPQSPDIPVGDQGG